MSDEPRPIGELIRRARERRRWTQQQLADAIGVHRVTVATWESDRAYPQNRIAALESVLGVSLREPGRHLAPVPTPPDPVPPEVAATWRREGFDGLLDELRLGMQEIDAEDVLTDEQKTLLKQTLLANLRQDVHEERVRRRQQRRITNGGTA